MADHDPVNGLPDEYQAPRGRKPGDVPWSPEAEEEVKGILGGLLADGHYNQSGWKENDTALAALAVRKFSLRHPCDGPGCLHRHHPRDVAMMRGYLDKLDLPGDPRILREAYAIKEAFRNGA